MRPRKSIDIIAIIAMILSLAVLLLALWALPPRINRNLHESIGRALAKEALGLLSPGGKITLITRDTEMASQPAIQILARSFEKEVRNAGVVLAATQSIQLDPLRPVEVPSGDFYEAIRRASPGQVIVSLLGPPVLTEEHRAKLGPIKPKIVALCSGNLAEITDLRGLFDAGLLAVAIVNRKDAATSSDKVSAASGEFDRLYVVVKAPNLKAQATSAR